MTLIRQSAVMAAKDLRIEIRGRYALGAVLPFAGTLAWSAVLLACVSRLVAAKTWPGRLGWLSAGAVAWGQVAASNLTDGLVIGTGALLAAATDEDRVTRDLASLSKHRVTDFWRDVAKALAKYDWRTSSFPGLTRSEQTMKAALRGAGGYRELRLQLLELLGSERGRVGSVAAAVREAVK